MKTFGPAMLVTAAFIGPGTVTTATLAGANFGYTLLWALLFSVVATLTLQEMAARLGLVTGKGLAETLRASLPSPGSRWIGMGLIIAAIGVGNAAYQGGNLTGAALGLSQLTSQSLSLWVLILAVVSSALLWFGQYHVLEKALFALVAVMSVVFLVTMFLATPDWMAILRGLIVPGIPDGATLTVIALVGTTVVPYNLFLHASLVASQRSSALSIPDQLSAQRKDSIMSIGIGGLITLAIISCAASAFFANQIAAEPGNLARQLAPLLGTYGEAFFALGLFSAGLTSAITAPLAAAYAVCGALGRQPDLIAPLFRGIWLTIMLIGAVFASLGFKPLTAILFAQAANGLLLPFVAVFLLWVMNQSSLLGEHRNGWRSNLLGFGIVAVVTALGGYKLFSALF